MAATAGPTGTDANGAGRQSLATGAVGPPILAIERALNGAGDWTTAHHLVARATSSPIDAGRHIGLYHGAPAVPFLLNAATADDRDRYAAARQSLTRHVRRLVRQRLTVADDRLRRGQPGTFAEYDIFYGLVGTGALLLRHLPDADELGYLLTYITRLTRPCTHDGQRLPGWWVDHDPDPTLPTPGGHANLGMAHGAAGLLALAGRTGHQVSGQTDAIERLYAWFDRWRQDDAAEGSWWPQWLTRDQLRTGRPTQAGLGRPSWCYGAPGIARALQLAAIATNHAGRQTDAEAVLAGLPERPSTRPAHQTRDLPRSGRPSPHRAPGRRRRDDPGHRSAAARPHRTPHPPRTRPGRRLPDRSHRPPPRNGNGPHHRATPNQVGHMSAERLTNGAPAAIAVFAGATLETAAAAAGITPDELDTVVQT